MSSCQKRCRPTLSRHTLAVRSAVVPADSRSPLFFPLYAYSLKQIKPEYFEESGTLRLLSDKVSRIQSAASEGGRDNKCTDFGSICRNGEVSPEDLPEVVSLLN